MPSVAIIIPAYNAVHTIRRCLDAVLGQEGLEDRPEIFIVDDGSNDGTPEIVRTYASKGVTLLQQENQGAGPARNTGTEASTADFVLFTDADCKPGLHWAAEMINGFISEDIGLVMGRTSTGHGLNNIYAKTQSGRDLVGGSTPGYTDRFNSNNMAMRREIALKLPFDKALRRGQDSDMGWRVLQAGYKTYYWPTASADHYHPYTFKSYFKNGFIEGRGTAQLHYKHGRYIPRDLAPFVAAVGCWILSGISVCFAWLGLLFFLLFLGALMFNELHYKKKSFGSSLVTFPVQVAWYLVKSLGYFLMMGRILLFLEPEIRQAHKKHKQWINSMK